MTEQTLEPVQMTAAAETPPAAAVKGPIFQSLQASRGLAALVVVLYHTDGLCSLPKYWALNSHYFYFGSSGVEFFFVLSGIVILHAHRRDLGKPARLQGYAIKRIQRIYPIYEVVLLALLPLYFLLPQFGKGFERDPRSIVDAILLLPIFHIDTIIPVAWTLTHEVMFYFVFALIVLNRRLGLAAFSMWMLAALACTQLAPGHPMLQAYASPLHLLFGLGMLVRWVWERLAWNGTALAIAGVAGFAGCAVFEDLTRPISWSLPLTYGLFAAIGSLGFMLIEKRRRIRYPGFLLLLGNASYSIYLVHYAVLSAAIKVFYKVWLRHPVPIVVPFALLVVTATAAGIALHLLVERPLLRWISKRPATPSSPHAA